MSQSSKAASVAAPDPASKIGKVYIVWSDEKKNLVANLASKYEAYKKTPGKTFEKKWQDVLSDCQKSKFCIEWITNPPKWDALETAFNRWMAETLKKYGISEEGANLSGLEEEADQFTKLMMSMAEDKAECEEAKKKEKEKEEKKRAAIFTHENAQINQQSKLGDSSRVAIKNELSPDVQSSFSSTVTSKKGRSVPNPFAIFGDVYKDDDRLIDLTVDEKEEELEFKRKRNARST
jgi:hypothetical protein